MATSGEFDGRLGEALCELAQLGELRRAKKPRGVWATPAAPSVRVLAGTKFTRESLRTHNIPEWAIDAILRERTKRSMQGCDARNKRSA